MNLEKLSNKELHQKCVEYGLPNIPITATSRKLMEKRLKAILSRNPLPTSTTHTKLNRGDTVNVPKPNEMTSSTQITRNKNIESPDKSQISSNRTTRRTIAETEKVVSTTTTINQSRSNQKISDISPESTLRQQNPFISKTPLRQTLYPHLPVKESSPQSVQLSKSEVLTTSYIQEPKRTTEGDVHKIYADVEEVDYCENKKSSEKTVLLSYENKLTKQPSPPKSNEPLIYEKEISMNPSTFKRISKLDSKKSNNSISARATLGKPPLNTTQQRFSTYNEAIASSQPISHSYVPSTLASTYIKQYTDQYENFENNHGEEEDDEVVVVHDSPQSKNIQSPYLSQFTRNLENLKAIPLNNKSIFTTGFGNYTSSSPIDLGQREVLNRRHTTNIAPRHSFNRRYNTDNDASFRQLLIALERKYHLKQTFLLIFIFILAIFIYVFFIQNV